MTLAVMGYHFQVMTRRLSEAVDAAIKPAGMGKSLPAEDVNR